MIKRRLGGYVLNRTNPSRFAEMMLKVLTHNIMLIVLAMVKDFYRACASPFPCVPVSVPRFLRFRFTSPRFTSPTNPLSAQA